MDSFDPFPELNTCFGSGDGGLNGVVPSVPLGTGLQPLGVGASGVAPAAIGPDGFASGHNPLSQPVDPFPQLIADPFAPTPMLEMSTGLDPVFTLEGPPVVSQTGEIAVEADGVHASAEPLLEPAETPVETAIEFDPADRLPNAPLEIISLPAEDPHAVFLRGRGYGRDDDDETPDAKDDEAEPAPSRSRTFVDHGWLGALRLNRSHLDSPHDPLAGISERFTNPYREPAPPRLRLSGRSVNPRGGSRGYRKFSSRSRHRCTRCASVLEGNRCTACRTEFCPTCMEVMEGECSNRSCPSNRAVESESNE